MFTGFSPETVDFLWGIRMNNNREWFLEHKKQYTETLYEPMKAMGQELFKPFLEKPGNVLKVSRIYRDARMHYPVPYKESLWLCIRQDVEWWAENPCLFFEIRPEGISYGFIHWKPRVSVLEDFRRDIAAKPDEFLNLIRTTEDTARMGISAELYRRPKPCPDPRLEPFYAWKGCIECVRAEEFSEDVFGPDLLTRVDDTFKKLIPLYDYFNKFKV